MENVKDNPVDMHREVCYERKSDSYESESKDIDGWETIERRRRRDTQEHSKCRKINLFVNHQTKTIVVIVTTLHKIGHIKKNVI